MVLALVGFGVTRLRIDNNFKLYFRPDSAVRVDDRVLNDTFGGTNSIQFLVQTAEADGIKDPRVLQGMERLQAFLETQPDVGKTQSMVDLIKRMNQAMHADDPAYYAIPESQELVAQYLFLYSLSGDPQDFDSLVDNDYRRATVWTFVKNDSTTNADMIAKRAQAIIDESFPPGVTRADGRQPAAAHRPQRRHRRRQAPQHGADGGRGVRARRHHPALAGRRPVRGHAALRGDARELRPHGLAGHAARHLGDDHRGDGDRHRRGLRDLSAVPLPGGAGAHRQRARRDAQLDADLGQGDPARRDLDHRRLRRAAGVGVRVLQHALEHGDGDDGHQRVLRAVLPARADDAVQAAVRLRRSARGVLQPGGRGTGGAK